MEYESEPDLMVRVNKNYLRMILARYQAIQASLAEANDRVDELKEALQAEKKKHQPKEVIWIFDSDDEGDLVEIKTEQDQ